MNISSTTVIDKNLKSSDISTLIGIKCCTYIGGEWNENLHTYLDVEYISYAKLDGSGVKLMAANVNISKYIIIIEYTKN